MFYVRCSVMQLFSTTETLDLPGLLLATCSAVQCQLHAVTETGDGSTYACNKEYENLDIICIKAGPLAHHVIPSPALKWFHIHTVQALSASREEEFGKRKATPCVSSGSVVGERPEWFHGASTDTHSFFTQVSSIWWSTVSNIRSDPTSNCALKIVLTGQSYKDSLSTLCYPETWSSYWLPHSWC